MLRQPKSILWTTLVAGLLLGPVFVTMAATAPWIPPPPEFPDTTANSGLVALGHKWDPSLGDAEFLLDVLPPAAPVAGDFNNDGFADLFIAQPGYTNESIAELRSPGSQLFLNMAPKANAERFIEVTDVAELDVPQHAYAASWGDVNGDGWLDLFVGGYGFAHLYLNDGDGTFTEASAALGIPQDGLVVGSAWGDIDGDNDLDLYLVRYTAHLGEDTYPTGGLEAQDGYENVLLENTGNGFVDATASAGLDDRARRSTSAVFVDVEMDGDQDLYVTNYGEPASLWLNDGSGTFTEATAAAGLADGGQATCQAWEDLDRDGDLDLVVARGHGEIHGLYVNDGTGTFTDQGASLGLASTEDVAGWGCAVFDFDADADMDLVFGHGDPDTAGAEQDLLFANRLGRDGFMHFEDVTAEAGDHDIPGFDSGPTFAQPRATGGLMTYDWNMDGQSAMDITSSHHDQDRTRVYRNVGWDGGWVGGNGNWMRVWLTGAGGNTPGYGAVVELEAGDLHLIRQVGTASGWGGQSVTELTFGINKSEQWNYERSSKDITLTVHWPDGTTETYPDTWIKSRSTRLIQDVGHTNTTLAPRAFVSLVDGEKGRNGYYTSEQVTVRVSAAELFRIENKPTGGVGLAYSLDGETWTNVEDPLSFGQLLTFEGEGTHKLWLETRDAGGNRAIFLMPIRIDTTPPSGQLLDPGPGGIYLQGTRVADTGDPVDTNRSVVFVPRALDAQKPAGALASDGTQPVRTEATDLGSGVLTVSYQVKRSNGFPLKDHTADRMLAPYLWGWNMTDLAAGEHLLTTTIEDIAGHITSYERKVLVIPTTASGVNATIQEGPSPLRPG